MQGTRPEDNCLHIVLEHLERYKNKLKVAVLDGRGYVRLDNPSDGVRFDLRLDASRALTVGTKVAFVSWETVCGGSMLDRLPQEVSGQTWQVIEADFVQKDEVVLCFVQ